ncbi:NF038132 family protein [Paracoccus sp. (in: a-proteobacteria)]|uniref:NF038132 family protein n=1 Tax=Paracoccus sp. TaxID=267 RepID=UPI0026DFEAFD|nr:NF038132 family protein [Paracoccus sp. (in: a-proteobacteria)]MDO5648502.1 NF038132 family protein [Paracoccus sp. (in: a-proteobacteria)]
MSFARYAAAALTTAVIATGAHAASLPADWVVDGNAGVAMPDGIMTAPPEQGPGYYYVTTFEGKYGVGALPGVGGSGTPIDGSTLTTSSFAAKAGDVLTFFFNYVTSDGAGYADYGWARLLNTAGDQAALLFTARTTPGGNSVPGFSMPDAQATLEPGVVDIIAGSPVWSVLGSESGTCYSVGCGYTGWVKSTYEFLNDGDFNLQFGVTNWSDTNYASAMAFAGAQIAGVDITPPTQPAPVPLPASAALLLAGMGALAATRRRKA